MKISKEPEIYGVSSMEKYSVALCKRLTCAQKEKRVLKKETVSDLKTGFYQDETNTRDYIDFSPSYILTAFWEIRNMGMAAEKTAAWDNFTKSWSCAGILSGKGKSHG